MLRGVDILAMRSGDARPKGRNVVLDKSFGARHHKDGVTVAKEIELEDKFENWRQMVPRSARRPMTMRRRHTTAPCSPMRSSAKREIRCGRMNPMD